MVLSDLRQGSTLLPNKVVADDMRTLSRRYRLALEMVVSVPKGPFTDVGIVSHRS
jgi:hypothetical protein